MVASTGVAACGCHSRAQAGRRKRLDASPCPSRGAPGSSARRCGLGLVCVPARGIVSRVKPGGVANLAQHVSLFIVKLMDQSSQRISDFDESEAVVNARQAQM